MNNRYWLFRRHSVFYLQDAQTRQKESLHTRNHMVPLHEHMAIANRARHGHIKLLYVASETLLRPEILVLLEQRRLFRVNLSNPARANYCRCWRAITRKMVSNTASSDLPASSARKRNTKQPLSCNRASFLRSRR
jgi:hypothetical protein